MLLRRQNVSVARVAGVSTSRRLGQALFDEREGALGQDRAVTDVAHDVGPDLVVYEEREVCRIREGVAFRV